MAWTRRGALKLAAAAPFLAAGAARAQAKYPTSAVKLVLPFGAGGVADVTARIVAEKLRDKLGQGFVIENMAGAGGVAAARAVLQQQADGYTLALFSNGTAISVPLFKALPFNPEKDFMPISSLGYFDFVVATNATSEYKSIADIIKYAKANPGKLNVGTINIGSSQNLSAELLKTAAGIDFTIVPFRGSPEVVVALLRDDIQVMIDNYVAIRPNLLEKKLLAVATTGTTRSQVLPDVPTVEQGGVKDYEVVSWNAMFAPTGTPPAVIQTLNQALQKVLVDPTVKQKMLDLGIEAKASTPQEISARLKSDIEKWGKVIERANIPKM
jgi:tripartite-type tricarboxylate transporter receptor subunit TctC